MTRYQLTSPSFAIFFGLRPRQFRFSLRSYVVHDHRRKFHHTATTHRSLTTHRRRLRYFTSTSTVATRVRSRFSHRSQSHCTHYKSLKHLSFQTTPPPFAPPQTRQHAETPCKCEASSDNLDFCCAAQGHIIRYRPD